MLKEGQYRHKDDFKDCYRTSDWHASRILLTSRFGPSFAAAVPDCLSQG